MKMRQFYTILSIFSILFFIIVNGLNSNLTVFSQDEPPFLKYDNNRFNFSIEYPSTWNLREIPNASVENLFNIEIITPFSDTQDMIQEKFLLSINKLPQNVTFKKYVDDALKQFNKTYTAFKLISDKTTNEDNLPSRTISYSYVAGMIPMSTKIVMTHEIFFYNDKIYVLSFGTHPDKYYDFLPIAEKIFDSFSITNSNPKIQLE
jgi:hypothetical protein